MDVHAHTHTPRKKWYHFFFEFMMLVLAVAIGFLAENIREHNVEKSREKQIMHALLQDLQADIVQIDSLKIRRETRNDNCDSLISLLSNYSTGGNKDNGGLIYLYGRNASRRIHFHPQDGVLQQLRNSGGFRIVHDTAVLKSINAYELLLIANKENIEVEEKELSEYTQVAAKLFNVKVFQEIMAGNNVKKPAGNPPLFSTDPVLLNEAGIKLHYWKRTSVSAIESLNQLKITAANLISRIGDEYHLNKK
jgi:hypothetical protein